MGEMTPAKWCVLAVAVFSGYNVWKKGLELLNQLGRSQG